MASDAMREAARIMVFALDDWFVKYMDGSGNKVSVDARLHLERFKESFAHVAAAIEDPKPEGWSAGNPRVDPCPCEVCEQRRVREKVQMALRVGLDEEGIGPNFRTPSAEGKK